MNGDFLRVLYNLLTGTEPYTSPQPCLRCSEPARFVGVVRTQPHGYGELSDVRYCCPNGHTFEKTWKARAVGGP